jgi:hypothetical protein
MKASMQEAQHEANKTTYEVIADTQLNQTIQPRKKKEKLRSYVSLV